jgi:lipoprotein-anchoring transpeptidase ErfK/SrfK
MPPRNAPQSSEPAGTVFEHLAASAAPATNPLPVAEFIESPGLPHRRGPEPQVLAADAFELPGVLSPEIERGVAIQLALGRCGISSGSIDGVIGAQTRGAIRTFQRLKGIPATGQVDVLTSERLPWIAPLFAEYTVTEADLARLTPVPKTWFGKSTRERLDYESILELASERHRAHPRLVRLLNPGVDWDRVTPGMALRVPAVYAPAAFGRAARLQIHLSERSLRAYDSDSNLMVHFPCSIARQIAKRPLGVLRVARVVPEPNYRFDPEIFRESPEARQIGRKLMIAPGPNNPVGTVWIGLDRPGYGIHGTPHPEDVGRTESHGCFRLANWNAEHLLDLVWVGMPVHVGM